MIDFSKLKNTTNIPLEKDVALFPIIDDFVRCYITKAGNIDWYEFANKAFDATPCNEKAAIVSMKFDDYNDKIYSPTDYKRGYKAGHYSALFSFLDAARKQARVEGGKYYPSGWYSINDRTPAEDEEVITLDGIGRISFAHIVADRDNIVNYDGWNIPDVAFWMAFEPSEDMNEFYEQK